MSGNAISISILHNEILIVEQARNAQGENFGNEQTQDGGRHFVECTSVWSKAPNKSRRKSNVLGQY
jgi:hypothetical protein